MHVYRLLLQLCLRCRHLWSYILLWKQVPSNWIFKQCPEWPHYSRSITFSVIWPKVKNYSPSKQNYATGQIPPLPVPADAHGCVAWSVITPRLLPRCMECRRGLAMRILSVCPSVKRVHCDKTEESYLDFYIIRKKIYPSFLRRRMVGGATPSTWNCGSTGPRWSEIADFEPVIARSASAVRPSEKSSINTNKKSATHFPMSPRWTSYVVSKLPKVSSVTQNVKKFEQ